MVRDQFLFRQLDLLRVKGKKKPMAVYELLAERNGDARLNKLVQDFEQAFGEIHRLHLPINTLHDGRLHWSPDSR